MSTTYDLVVIGTGVAGNAAASAAHAAGHSVAQIECGPFGGTCLNSGCDPTKTLLHAAHLLYHMQQAGAWGLHIADPQANWQAVLQRVQAVKEQMLGGTAGEARARLAQQGIDLYQGVAQFRSPHDIAIGDTVLTGEHILIAAGGHTTIPNIPGLREAGFITHVEAVHLTPLPRRLAIFGGSAQGMEFAQIFQRFGVAVTVMEKSPMLLPQEDREVADQLLDVLQREGLHDLAGVEIRDVTRNGATKRVAFRQHDADLEIAVDEILLATGLTPNLDTLALEKAGVEAAPEGIRVDTALRTNVSHIFAAGDVIGTHPFTHAAYAQGQLAAHNAFADEPQPFDDRVIPWVTFTDPELAHVGVTEDALRQAGTSYSTRHFPFARVERAIIAGETAGQVKLLVGERGDILGGHILSSRAGDLIAMVVLAMHAGLTIDHLSSPLLPYPTFAEGVRWAAAGQT